MCGWARGACLPVAKDTNLTNKKFPYFKVLNLNTIVYLLISRHPYANLNVIRVRQ